MKRTQRGITMLGFLITLSIVIFFAYCAMKIVPMYIEFYSVKKALASLASENRADSVSKEKLRESFGRYMKIDYVSTVKPEMLKIESTDAGYRLLMDYERRETLLANLDVVGKFRAEQAVTRGTATP